MSELARLIRAARRLVAMTGAGISTESGIPDFRSPGGIWESFRIIQYDEFMASEAARLEDWRSRFHMEDQLGAVSPNLGHEVIARWLQSGKCTRLITQNIDGLHQAAGAPEATVIEIHGNARHARCTACGLRHEIGECRAMLEATGRAPRCRTCGGIVKSAVVMFGETMPEAAMEQAMRAARTCDLFLAIGTSLQVYPAAGLPVIARGAGARFAILNRDRTDLDRLADVVVRAGIGDTLREFIA